MKFIPVFLGVGLLALLGLWVGRRFAERPQPDPGVEANARLIGYASVALLIPLAAEVVTDSCATTPAIRATGRPARPRSSCAFWPPPWLC